LPADFKPYRSNPASYTFRDFLQRQFRYPAIDLRNQVEGTSYGYFEVSETGAVENRRVVGSLTPSVDAEVLRTLNTIPNATTPPRQQGRPVRVAYVVPVNLKIQ
jgi:outer membrane biosynthesis protein TonB